VVVATAGGLALQCCGPGAPGPVPVAFDDPALRHRRRGGHNELLGRAVGWRRERAPTVLDATAGFGRDAFILADLGCAVRLCERHPAMAELLQWALAQAADADPWLVEVTGRMSFVGGDATLLPPTELVGVDVIYLDPMFPTARRALPGKEMQVLQTLLGSPPGAPDEDDRALLAWGLAQPVARVAVKRPRKAPPLPGPPPGFVLRGRSVRFDVYPLRSLD